MPPKTYYITAKYFKQKSFLDDSYQVCVIMCSLSLYHYMEKNLQEPFVLRMYLSQYKYIFFKRVCVSVELRSRMQKRLSSPYSDIKNEIVTHSNLCLATAIHKLQWVKITHNCLIWDQTSWIFKHTFRSQ